MRGSRSTTNLPMECRVNTLFPFVKKFALLRIAVPYLLDPTFKKSLNQTSLKVYLVNFAYGEFTRKIFLVSQISIFLLRF